MRMLVTILVVALTLLASAGCKGPTNPSEFTTNLPGPLSAAGLSKIAFSPESGATLRMGDPWSEQKSASCETGVYGVIFVRNSDSVILPGNAWSGCGSGAPGATIGSNATVSRQLAEFARGGQVTVGFGAAESREAFYAGKVTPIVGEGLTVVWTILAL